MQSSKTYAIWARVFVEGNSQYFEIVPSRMQFCLIAVLHDGRL